MYGSSLDISWLYFGDDGQIVRNPKHGVNPVQWDKEKTDNAANTGTWKQEGEKIVLHWLNGKTASWTYEKEGGHFSIIDGGISTIQDAMPDGYPLEGKFAALTVLPNVSNSNTIWFTKDGRFTLNKTGTVTTPDVAKAVSGDQSGKYSINGNTLTLQFEDGKETRSVIAIWESDGEKNLVINTRYFPQEGK